MSHRSRARRRRRPRGLTLIELMIVMMLVGLTMAAMIGSSRAFTQANGEGIYLSTAEFLIEEIRERMAALPAVDPDSGIAVFGPETGESTVAGYDDVDDFDGLNLNPPIDVQGAAMGQFADYTQHITVENVTPADLNAVATDHSTHFMRVTVRVSLGGRDISSSSWIRTR